MELKSRLDRTTIKVREPIFDYPCRHVHSFIKDPVCIFELDGRSVATERAIQAGQTQPIAEEDDATGHLLTI